MRLLSDTTIRLTVYTCMFAWVICDHKCGVTPRPIVTEDTAVAERSDSIIKHNRMWWPPGAVVWEFGI